MSAEEEEEEELAEPVDWDAAWQAEVALPLFVESLARNYNTGMEPKQVAMQRLVGVCIAIGVFCAVCHLYVLHTGGILIIGITIVTPILPADMTRAINLAWRMLLNRGKSLIYARNIQ